MTGFPARAAHPEWHAALAVPQAACAMKIPTGLVAVTKKDLKLTI